MEDIEYWVWLSRIEKLKPRILLDLLLKYKNPRAIWNLKKSELKTNKIKEEIVDNILNKKYRTNLDKYIEYMQKHQIEIINIFDPDYPLSLKDIYDPPVILYLKGNKKILNENRYSDYWM